jgi:hypothetical protein
MEKIMHDINNLKLVQFNILPKDLEKRSIDRLEKTQQSLDELRKYVENATTKKPKITELTIIKDDHRIRVCFFI